ncbi:MAG: beta-lactamase family protein, partial [Rubrivivax sp.]|nr:beta-lactamase family protein [Rubrivivax sp.]
LGVVRLDQGFEPALQHHRVYVAREPFAPRLALLGQVLGAGKAGLLHASDRRSLSRSALLQMARINQRFAKVGAPNETFEYSDTGYNLLGEIIEVAGR